MKIKQFGWFLLSKFKRAMIVINIEKNYPVLSKILKQKYIRIKSNLIWRYIFEPKLNEYNSLLCSGNKNEQFYKLEKFLNEKFVTVHRNFKWKEFNNYKYIPSNIKNPQQNWKFTKEESDQLCKEIGLS